MTFEEANEVTHYVFEEWHYPIMLKYGYEPVTKEKVGFVRSYEYQNKTGSTMVCSTGASADYFIDKDNKCSDYGTYLEKYLINKGISK